MDDLRWILAIVGAVVVVAIYLSGRFEREEWKRDREAPLGKSRPVTQKKAAPQNKSKINNDDRQASKPQQEEHKVSVGLNSEADVNEALKTSEPEPPFIGEEVKTVVSDVAHLF